MCFKIKSIFKDYQKEKVKVCNVCEVGCYHISITDCPYCDDAIWQEVDEYTANDVHNAIITALRTLKEEEDEE